MKPVPIVVFLLVGIICHGALSQVTELKLRPPSPCSGFGNAISLSRNHAIVGECDGAVYVFRRDGESWPLQSTLVASDSASSFGSGVSISREYAIVGAEYDGLWGSAYIFRHEPGGSWIEDQKIVPSRPTERFGDQVCIDGNTAIVGTWDAKFFIFEDDSSWAVSSTHSRLGIGPAVSLSGGYALIGAPYDSANNYSGSAYVFKKVGSAWVQTAKLLPSIGGDGNFGRSVAISGNNALVGAGGSAYVFRREGEGWTEIARLVASDGTVTDGFGAAVSLFANYAIVSAGGNDGCAEDAGAAYIFRRAGGSWNEVQKLTSSDCRTNDSFGWAVSMNDRFAAVGTNSSITPFLDRTFLYSAYIESESEFSNLDSKPFLMTSVLFKNYPDPFNPSTTISYNLIENTHVTLKVYNTVGQLVKTVVEDYQAEGYHEMIWDGRNEVGATVSSGIYIYRMTAGSFVETKRMLLLK